MAGWYCSLRTEEYDHEHDGIETGIKRGKNAIGNAVGKDDKLGSMARNDSHGGSFKARKSHPALRRTIENNVQP